MAPSHHSVNSKKKNLCQKLFYFFLHLVTTQNSTSTRFLFSHYNFSTEFLAQIQCHKFFGGVLTDSAITALIETIQISDPLEKLSKLISRRWSHHLCLSELHQNSPVVIRPLHPDPRNYCRCHLSWEQSQSAFLGHWLESKKEQGRGEK